MRQCVAWAFAVQEGWSFAKEAICAPSKQKECFATSPISMISNNE